MAALVYFALLFVSIGLSQAVQLSYGPRLSFFSYVPSIEVSVYLGRANPLKGPGTPRWYYVQYRDKSNNRPWKNYGKVRDYPITNITKDYDMIFEITEVERDKTYEVRVILQDTSGFIFGANDVASSIIYTGSSKGSGIQLTLPPTCENTDYGVIEVTVVLGANNPIKGDGPAPAFCILQYRDQTWNETWIDFRTIPYPTYDANYKQKITVPYLRSGHVYEFRMTLQDEEGVKYEGNNVPSSLCGTKCDIPTSYDYNISSTIVKEDDSSKSLVVYWSYDLANDHWCPEIGSEVTYVRDSEQKKEFLKANYIYFRRWTTNDVVTLFVRCVTTGGYVSYSKEFVYPPQPHGQGGDHQQQQQWQQEQQMQLQLQQQLQKQQQQQLQLQLQLQQQEQQLLQQQQQQLQMQLQLQQQQQKQQQGSYQQNQQQEDSYQQNQQQQDLYQQNQQQQDSYQQDSYQQNQQQQDSYQQDSYQQNQQQKYSYQQNQQQQDSYQQNQQQQDSYQQDSYQQNQQQQDPFQQNQQQQDPYQQNQQQQYRYQQNQQQQDPFQQNQQQNPQFN